MMTADQILASAYEKLFIGDFKECCQLCSYPLLQESLPDVAERLNRTAVEYVGQATGPPDLHELWESASTGGDQEMLQALSSHIMNRGGW